MGCAGLPNKDQTESTPPSAEESAPIPIPNELQDKINLSEALGAELYINDKMAIIGTDVMLERLNDAQRARICGYVVFREADARERHTGSWWVEFFVDRDKPKIGYRVHITHPASPGPATTKFETVTPPSKPSDGELLLHRAIRTSLAAIPDRPNQSANPVVMPGSAIGEDGVLAYLLAGTSRDNTVVFGKHYRVLVSGDGQRANRIDPLTRSALEVPLPPPMPDGSAPSLLVAHLLGDYPLETHVFISLLHHKPLLVHTEQYIWRISEGKVSLVNLRKAALNEAKDAYGRGDYATAHRKLKGLALQGDPTAQCGLAALYALGKGVPQDYGEAARLYRQAAERGNPMGQFSLGLMYQDGRGVPQNQSEASTWFLKAAEQGYDKAQCNLGVMYAEGQGVGRDYIKAHVWLSLAAGQGDQKAQESLALLAGHMSASEIAKARRLANERKLKGNN